MKINDDYDEMMLLCPPADAAQQRRIGITEVTPAEGMIKVKCEACGNEVWLGVKLQAERAKCKQAKVICFECGLRQFGKVLPDIIKNAGGKSAAMKTIFGDFPPQ